MSLVVPYAIAFILDFSNKSEDLWLPGVMCVISLLSLSLSDFMDLFFQCTDSAKSVFGE